MDSLGKFDICAFFGWFKYKWISYTMGTPTPSIFTGHDPYIEGA